nr:hypothetical protein [Tanacetum cinerariifolium]
HRSQFYKKTSRKLEFNRKEQVDFDKTKVECFNCHRKGHFARDCRSARNSGNRSGDTENAGYRGRNNGKSPIKEEDKNALVVYDGLGTNNWSYQVEEEATDFALMAFTSNPSSSSSSNYEIDFVKTGETVKHVKPVKPVQTAEQTEKSKNFSSNPKIDNKDWNGKMTQKPRLGFGFIKKACFVCDSMSHLIKDCTFHEDRMARKYVLPNNVGNGTGHKESRPVWNNVQRINHQNKSSPTIVFTRFGRIPVSGAKPKVAASTSAAKPVNTVGSK